MTHDVEPGTSRTLLPELGRLPGHLLWRAHARVLTLVAAKLPAGVDVHAYTVLQALADGRARSQQSLSETTKVGRTTMSAVATRLAEDGLVERVRNPHDRRSYALTRTPSGAAAVRRWERHVIALEDAIAGDFNAAERTELRDLLLAVGHDELPDDAPGELLSSIGFLITRVHFRMHRDFLDVLEPLGIEPRHFAALVALRAIGAVPQAELARHLGTSPASVVQIVDDLEAADLLERRRSPTDRRTQELHLCEAAPRALAEAERLAAGILDVRMAPLTTVESERLVELLRRFVVA